VESTNDLSALQMGGLFIQCGSGTGLIAKYLHFSEAF